LPISKGLQPGKPWGNAKVPDTNSKEETPTLDKGREKQGEEI